MAVEGWKRRFGEGVVKEREREREMHLEQDRECRGCVKAAVSGINSDPAPLKNFRTGRRTPLESTFVKPRLVNLDQS